MSMTVLPATENFVVAYDDSLANGAALADAVVQSCEGGLSSISELFGNIMPPAASLPFNVNLVPGPGGGSHGPGCAGTTVTCYVSVNSDAIGVPALLNAEVAEVFMAVQNQGLDCGGSAGEALSRVVPTILDPTLRWRFAVGNDWLNGGRPNWVDATEQTDQDFVSIGCGTLFLNYLAHQLLIDWQTIVAAAAPTLGQMASNLGLHDAWNSFNGLLEHYFPSAVSVLLPDDDPFPLGHVIPDRPWPPKTTHLQHVPELVAQIIAGIIQDGGGVLVLNGRIIRVPPQGPVFDALVELAALAAAEEAAASG
jgi:hypothetical protein